MDEYRVIRKTPLLRILFIFIPGIVIAYYFSDFISAYIFLLSALTFILLTILVFLIAVGKGRNILDFVIHILVLNISVLITTYVLPRVEVIPESQHIKTAIVCNSPQLRKKSILIPSKIALQNEFGTTRLYKINIYSNYDSALYKNLSPGDNIIFLEPITRIKNYGNPFEFDLVHAMASKGIFYQAWVKSGEFEIVKINSVKAKFLRGIEKIKKSINDQTGRYIKNSDAKALIIAFITGDRQLISDEMQDAYVHAGVIHILSVSGLHIGIIFMVFNFLLKSMDKNRRLKILKTIIILFAVWFYAVLSGLSPSVTRSALMFSLITIGLSFRRDISFYNILAASALIMLLFNPLQLFDIGFQLSYLAVAGIVFFQPRFNKLFSFSNSVANYIYQLFIVSFAAQIATFPLLLFYFNQFPVYFWLANLFVIPLTFILMMLIVAFLFTSYIPVLGVIFGFLCSITAWLLNSSVMLIENFPGSIIQGIYISKIEIFLIFTFIVAITIWLEVKRSGGLIAGMFILNLFIISSIIQNYKDNHKETLTIYNTAEVATLSLFTHSGNYIFSDAFDERLLLKVTYSCSNHWKRFSNNEICIQPFDSIPARLPVRCNNLKADNLIINLNGKSKMIILDQHISVLSDSIFSSNDILFVAGNFLPPNKRIEVKEIVLSPGLNRCNSEKWVNYSQVNEIGYFNIKQEGAYSIEL
jgi:competence protein ComEC